MTGVWVWLVVGGLAAVFIGLTAYREGYRDGVRAMQKAAKFIQERTQ